MARYHINDDGVAGVCSAVQGKCPFGGEASHYPSAEAARAAYETSMAGATLSAPTRKEIELPSYPDPVYDEVTKSVSGTGVRVGDQVIRGKRALRVIKIKSGYKYNALTVEDPVKGSRVVNVPLEGEVSVIRREERDESRAARERVGEERLIAKHVRDYTPLKVSAVKDLTDAVSRGLDPTQDHISAIERAHGRDKVMSDLASKTRELYSVGDPYPHVRAVEILRDTYRDEIVTASSLSGEPRAKDIFVHAALKAKADFVKQGVAF